MDIYHTTSARALICYEGKLLVEWVALKSLAFLPGGTVESNEDLVSALRRELGEELEGSDFSIGRYLGEIGHRWRTPNGIDSCLNHFYEVAVTNPEKLRSREVGREIRWLPINSSGIALLKPPSLRMLLLDDLDNRAAWKIIDSELDGGI